MQHKREAYWFYRFLSLGYDRYVNPLFWTPRMRGEALAARAAGPAGPADGRRGRGHRLRDRGRRRSRGPRARDHARPVARTSSRGRAPSPRSPACAKVIGDAEDLPFGDRRGRPLRLDRQHRVLARPAARIAEAYRVVKPGGVAMLAGPLPPGNRVARRLADAWMLFPPEAEYRAVVRARRLRRRHGPPHRPGLVPSVPPVRAGHRRDARRRRARPREHRGRGPAGAVAGADDAARAGFAGRFVVGLARRARVRPLARPSGPPPPRRRAAHDAAARRRRRAGHAPARRGTGARRSGAVALLAPAHDHRDDAQRRRPVRRGRLRARRRPRRRRRPVQSPARWSRRCASTSSSSASTRSPTSRSIGSTSRACRSPRASCRAAGAWAIVATAGGRPPCSMALTQGAVEIGGGARRPGDRDGLLAAAAAAQALPDLGLAEHLARPRASSSTSASTRISATRWRGRGPSPGRCGRSRCSSCRSRSRSRSSRTSPTSRATAATGSRRSACASAPSTSSGWRSAS